MRLLLVHGLRVGSVMDANIDDLGYDSGHRVLYLTRKGGHRDRVAIPPPVGDAIDQMLAQRGQPRIGPAIRDRTRPAALPSLVIPPTQARWPDRQRSAGRAAVRPLPPGYRDQRVAGSAAAARRAGLCPAKDPRTTRRYDKRRGNLDRAGSYVLAGRYGQRGDG